MLDKFQYKCSNVSTFLPAHIIYVFQCVSSVVYKGKQNTNLWINTEVLKRNYLGSLGKY